MISSNGFYLNASTSIVMSQKLQQAIQILQFNNIELADFIKSESEKNPFIKLIDRNTSLPNSRGNKNINSENLNYIENIPENENIYNSISNQIETLFSSKLLKNIAFTLMENLDEHGLLQIPLKIIALKTQNSEDLIESVLKKLQNNITPVGIFARNIKECLQLKLSEKYDNNIPINLQKIADKIDLITHKKFEEFINLCKIKKSDVMSCFKEIIQLGLYPNIQYDDDIQTIIPDVYITKTNNNTWKIELNNETLPKVVMDEEYISIVKSVRKSTKEKRYYTENINSANSIIKAINMRACTIMKVTKEILEQQRDFFEKGPEFLAPMILKDIADEIGLHESTVSRATNNKYIMTDFGIFEFKYFFSSKTEDSYGNSFSSNMIKEKIKNLIKNEDKFSPYSDEVIASLLSEIGINIARRTISKYRESMNIPTSNKRKKNKILYKI